MQNILRNHRAGRLVSALLLGSLAIRALLPKGYMPGNLLAGNFAALCTVASAATYKLLTAPSSHGHQHSSTPGEAEYSIESTCPIGSGLFSDALPESGQPYALVPQIAGFSSRPTARFHALMPRRNYSPRAPPAA